MDQEQLVVMENTTTEASHSSPKDEESNSGGWFSFSVLKNLADDIIKTTEEVAYGCKNDLLEFTENTVNVADSVKQNILPLTASGVSNALNAITNLVVEEGEEEEEEDEIDRVIAQTTGFLGNIQTALTDIISQAVEITPASTKMESTDKSYAVIDRICNETDSLLLQDPLKNEKTQKIFQEYMEKFSFTEHAGQIASLMNSEDQVRKIHEKFVPKVISEDDFWKRFFFRQMLIQEEDELKRRLIQQAVDSRHDQDNVKWEDEDEPEEEEVKEIFEAPVVGTEDKIDLVEMKPKLSISVSETSYDMVSVSSEPLPNTTPVLPKQQESIPAKEDDDWAEWE